MLRKLSGLFKKWYCPDCNRVLKWREVVYQEEFCGYYTRYWYRCLKCGSPKAKTFQDRLEELATKKENNKKK